MRRLFGSSGPGFLPVVVVARNRDTGVPEDRVAFRIQPDYDVTLRQLTRYGRQQAAWVWCSPRLAGSFLLVEVGALVLAVHVTNRIITSINHLSRGAEQVGAGNLEYRVAGAGDDQLGRLAATFNEMTASPPAADGGDQGEGARLEQELRLARNVQESLYPKVLPTFPGVQLAAVCEPARSVSGDLYDAFRWVPAALVCCAPTSAVKGIAAALLMAGLHSVVRSLLGLAGRLPDRVQPAASLHSSRPGDPPQLGIVPADAGQPVSLRCSGRTMTPKPPCCDTPQHVRRVLESHGIAESRSTRRRTRDTTPPLSLASRAAT